MKSPSHVQLFATPWTVAYQAPLSMEFSRQEYWSGLPFPSPRDLLNPGIEPRSPALQADSLPSEPASPIKCGEWNQSNRTKCHFVFELSPYSQTLKRVCTRADNTHTLVHPWVGRWEEKVEQNEPSERGSVRGQGRRIGPDFVVKPGEGVRRLI